MLADSGAVDAAVSDVIADGMDVTEPDVVAPVLDCGTLVVPDPAAICLVAGGLGQDIRCSIRIAALAPPYPWTKASGLQINLEYDPGKLKLIGLQFTVCPPQEEGKEVECEHVTTPPAIHPVTGHSVFVSPKNYADWVGGGSFVSTPSGDPTTPLPQGVVDGDILTTDETFLEVLFRLQTDVDVDQPVPILAPALLLADLTAEPIPASLDWSFCKTEGGVASAVIVYSNE